MTKKSERLFDFDSALEDLFGMFKANKEVIKMVSTSPEPTGMMKSYNERIMATEMDVEIELPGVSPSNVSVFVQTNKVIVKGRRLEKVFKNTYTISEQYVAETAVAWLSNGLLTVRVKKSPTIEPKEIPVRILQEAPK